MTFVRERRVFEIVRSAKQPPSIEIVAAGLDGKQVGASDLDLASAARAIDTLVSIRVIRRIEVLGEGRYVVEKPEA